MVAPGHPAGLLRALRLRHGPAAGRRLAGRAGVGRRRRGRPRPGGGPAVRQRGLAPAQGRTRLPPALAPPYRRGQPHPGAGLRLPDAAARLLAPDLPGQRRPAPLRDPARRRRLPHPLDGRHRRAVRPVRTPPGLPPVARTPQGAGVTRRPISW
ncbi:hypothetical protein SBRY_20185 [Actinacidiphila bryophytorum]|uniref:Uncharacterized protein n=1 Tax=Actinacidiphila bryophytorum TaxID=1436133 RepID=A0A9W4E5J9_9ACTN|nr:hypothetical protein SBRY_20185 [Actinacidiphila bryophytorum]